ncbi:MAG: hypothetical protein M3N42_16180 [Cyanobacteriota bacterium]|nr:hypothetical protein [Cyanobacteriota bacterium]
MAPRIVEIILPFPPISLNPYLRTHWAERDAIMEPYRETIADNLIGIEPFPKVYLEWEWTFFGSEQKFLDRDGDNIWTIGSKIICDVVKSRILKDDSNRYIQTPTIHWVFNNTSKDPEIYGTGEVLLRLSDVPLYGGQFIRMED